MQQLHSSLRLLPISASASSFSNSWFCCCTLTSVSGGRIRLTARCARVPSHTAEPWRMCWITWPTVRQESHVKVGIEALNLNKTKAITYNSCTECAVNAYLLIFLSPVLSSYFNTNFFFYYPIQQLNRSSFCVCKMISRRDCSTNLHNVVNYYLTSGGFLKILYEPNMDGARNCNDVSELKQKTVLSFWNHHKRVIIELTQWCCGVCNLNITNLFFMSILIILYLFYSCTLCILKTNHLSLEELHTQRLSGLLATEECFRQAVNAR